MSLRTAIAKNAANYAGLDAACALNNANVNNRPRLRVDD
mgnify:CR=1 FL=1